MRGQNCVSIYMFLPSLKTNLYWFLQFLFFSFFIVEWRERHCFRGKCLLLNLINLPLLKGPREIYLLTHSMIFDNLSNAVATTTRGLLGDAWYTGGQQTGVHECFQREWQPRAKGAIGGRKKCQIISQLIKHISNLQLNWNKLCLAQKNNQ